MEFIPEPLTPADIQGRDLGPMPLETSWVVQGYGDWIELNARQFQARICLMCWSWAGKPSASMLDCTDIQFSRLTRESSPWFRKNRALLLNPWIKCTADSRLYHPWLAEQAIKRINALSVRRFRLMGITQGEWQRRRTAVFKRDDYTCRYCGARGGRLECDHIVPLASGGSSEIENLATSCSECNRAKSTIPLENWVAGRAQ